MTTAARSRRPAPRAPGSRAAAALLACTIALGAPAVAQANGAASFAPAIVDQRPGGQVRFVKRVEPSFDRYLDAPTQAFQGWMNEHFWRTEVFTPHFDDKTSWYPAGWAYIDSISIGKEDSARADWTLRRSAGGPPVFLNYGCGAGTCAAYAADVANPSYRQAWIAGAQAVLARGNYRGLWIDDVNLERTFNTGDAPTTDAYSPWLGRFLSAADWRLQMASFMEEIRAAIPRPTELLHNSLWFAGREAGGTANPEVRRQIGAADFVNLERGFNDAGLTGGTGEWSVDAVRAYIRAVHGLGAGVIVDAFDESQAGMEYNLANYLLTSDGLDAIGEIHQGPDQWWSGFDVDLGYATSRPKNCGGLLCRFFWGGVVLVHDPAPGGDAARRTFTLPGGLVDLTGAPRGSVTLGPAQGAVLRYTSQRGSFPAATFVGPPAP